MKFGLSEKHTKFEKNLPHGLDIYVLSMRTSGQIFVCFSESPNFMQERSGNTFVHPSLLSWSTVPCGTKWRNFLKIIRCWNDRWARRKSFETCCKRIYIDLPLRFLTLFCLQWVDKIYKEKYYFLHMKFLWNNFLCCNKMICFMKMYRLRKIFGQKGFHPIVLR